jgi:hypothetical protein
MAFGWAGAANGAADAAQLLRDEQRQVGQDALARQESEMRMRALLQQLAASNETMARNKRGQQLQEAAITLEQQDAMGPGAEVSPGVAGVLKGTPYGARVQDHATLPSRSVPMPVNIAAGANASGAGPWMQAQVDPGGRQYSTLAPTATQARETGDRAALDAAVNNPQLPPPVRQLINLHRIGVRVPNPESLEMPTERDARARLAADADFADFKRRADYTGAITERARAAARRDATDPQVTPRDRREALRNADAAAADYLDTLKNITGELPKGVDPGAVRQQFIDEYLGVLEPGAGDGAGRRPRRQPVEGLTMRPTRTGRITSGDSVVAPGRGPKPQGGGGDAYEQYLARTGGR